MVRKGSKGVPGSKSFPNVETYNAFEDFENKKKANNRLKNMSITTFFMVYIL